MATSVIRAISWKRTRPPKKVLVMRFQAMGDVVITLPYLQDLKTKLPETIVHFLTREEVTGIPCQLKMFNRVIVIKGGRNVYFQFLWIFVTLPWLWAQRYDVVIDLQNHWLSRLIRKLLNARSWSEFDRSSPVAAGERTRSAIEAVNIGTVSIAETIFLKTSRPWLTLMPAEFNKNNPFIILNPAGAFESRHWPIDYFIAFAQRWLEEDDKMQFLVLGLRTHLTRTKTLKIALGEKLVDITGLTTPEDAFQIVRHAKLVVSEDSGLMHMAWTQRVPTIAIFGSTPEVWSRPLGKWSWCFNSADLPCGSCFQEKCKYHDNHCLTRWTPEIVFEKSLELTGTVLTR